ncbi:MAG: cytochrome C oxidase subunit IV family protein [Myxococcota bacterium]
MSTPNSHAHHVVPISTYLKVFGALLGLTALTVTVAEMDLGRASLLVALTVAVIKAGLVAAIFMHLWYDERINLMILVGSLIFLVFFLLFPFIDIGSRGAIDPVQDTFTLEQEKAVAK